MNILKYNLIALASLGVLFSSCMTERKALEEHHFDNKVFINVDNTVEQKIVKAGGYEDYSRTLSISTALKADEKITAQLVINPDRLADFQEAYVKDAVLYPVENCTIENAELTIEAGSNLSSQATVKFTKMNELDLNLVYVLPVSLTNVKGIELLKSKDTVYYMFKGGALINVVVNLSNNRAGAKSWGNPDALTGLSEFTIEFLVHPNKFGRLISTVLGTEGDFLLRFGDAGLPDNQLQIASNRNHSNSDLQAEIGEWTHFAVVFNRGQITVYKNGSMKLDESDAKTQVTFRPYGNDTGEVSGRYFWLGYSYSSDRFFDGEMSEIRIWRRCLTKDEINVPAHFYTANPNDPDLAAYWKCDDAAGKVLKDYTANHNDLTLDSETKWPSVSLPATK